MNQCKDCKFSEKNDVNTEYPYIYCRYPPQEFNGTSAFFPGVRKDWWCGEFQEEPKFLARPKVRPFPV